MVVHVVDGDTVDVAGGERIRVIGIDTPESGQPCATQATTAMSALVLNKPVRLTPGARDDRDRYGRLLRYLDLIDGTDAGLTLIEQGLAVARYDSRDGYGAHPREAAYVAADAASPSACLPSTTPALRPPAATTIALAPPARACDPSYPTVCIPPAPPDLDCGDIPYRRFPVLAPDPHHFDGNDDDGIGCESG